MSDSLAGKFFHVEEVLANAVSLGTSLAEVVVEVVLRTIRACDLIDLLLFLAKGRIVEGVGAEGRSIQLHRLMRVTPHGRRGIRILLSVIHPDIFGQEGTV